MKLLLLTWLWICPCCSGLLLFIFVESSLLHHQLHHSYSSLLCWDTQTSRGPINVSFVKCSWYEVVCFVFDVNIQYLPLTQAGGRSCTFHSISLVYFFDLCCFSIAARCRTVLAEYNMSCDDVSVQISAVVWPFLYTQKTINCLIYFSISTDGEANSQATTKHTVTPPQLPLGGQTK